jgi:hypothetical protein
MQRISSKTTFYYKRLFPFFWFGIVIAVFIGMLFSGNSNHPVPAPVFFVPVILAVVGYIVMKKLVFPLVDEVWDAGNKLVVKNRGEQISIALEDIMNVGYTMMVNPPMVTLRLRSSSRFGKEITFSPPARFAPLSRNPLIDELIERIDAKRRSS